MKLYLVTYFHYYWSTLYFTVVISWENKQHSCLTDISEIQSLASDHSGRSHDRPPRHSRSRSPDQRSEPSDHSRQSPQQPSNGR